MAVRLDDLKKSAFVAAVELKNRSVLSRPSFLDQN
jgi:hypothetical protein